MKRRSKRIHDTATRQKPSAAGATRLELLVFGAALQMRRSLPRQGMVVLGRSDQADVCLEDISVSRRHAALHISDELEVEDLGSANGTRVRGRQLGAGARERVRVGELIELGGVIAVLQPGHHDADGAAGSDVADTVGVATAMPEIVVLEESMKAVFRLVERVARGTISVLVLGETGVGKEVIAEAVHRASGRAEGPFLRVNCGALPEALAESELFGHARGAFTGAASDKIGLLEAGHGGSIFLDEVGELSPQLQVKLLRVLEDRRLRRVGDVLDRAVDVRFVAATHRDLRAESARGRFREDLYFRLAGISIAIPPLRERPRELLPLARAFVTLAAAKERRAPPQLSEAAARVLERYDWPGNLRELRNVIERAVLLADDRIGPEHLMIDVAHPAAPASEQKADATAAALASDVEALERRRILEALQRCGGSQTQAAKALGISRSKLVARLDAYGAPRPRKRR